MIKQPYESECTYFLSIYLFLYPNFQLHLVLGRNCFLRLSDRDLLGWSFVCMKFYFSPAGCSYVFVFPVHPSMSRLTNFILSITKSYKEPVCGVLPILLQNVLGTEPRAESADGDMSYDGS